MAVELRRRPTLGHVLAALVGVAVFAYVLHRAGTGEVLDGIQRVGWAFAGVIALGGVRFLLRAAAWMRCLERPNSLKLGQVFQAVAAGDALGNITPLNVIVGEPAKGLLLRGREPLRRTLPALAVENLFYTLSAVLMIVGGLVAVVLMFQAAVQVATVTMIAAMALLVGTVHIVIWKRWLVATTSIEWLAGRSAAPPVLTRVAGRVAAGERQVHILYPRDRRRLVPLALLELGFHALGVAEAFLVLAVISDQPPALLHAIVFEAINRFISFAFRFVPLRVGVDEAGSGLFADLLALGTATGVTLAIVRKGRMLVWIAIGIAIVVRRGGIHGAGDGLQAR